MFMINHHRITQAHAKDNQYLAGYELPQTKVHGFWEQRVVFRISIVIHNVPVYSPHLTHRTRLFTRAGPQPIICFFRPIEPDWEY